MSKLRSISTSIWADSWMENLTPTEKLLFIYLLTNEHTNMLGVYEVSLSRISFETGIDKGTVRKALEGFGRVNKVYFKDENYIILVNFLKHQKYNDNMKKSAIDSYNNLPKHLKINGIEEIKERDDKGFQRLCKGFGMVRKVEVEVEDKNKRFEFEIFWMLYKRKGSNKKVSRERWKKLTEEEKKRAIEHAPKYIKSIPEERYRKTAEVYLNQKHWENEVLTVSKKRTDDDFPQIAYPKENSNPFLEFEKSENYG